MAFVEIGWDFMPVWETIEDGRTLITAVDLAAPGEDHSMMVEGEIIDGVLHITAFGPVIEHEATAPTKEPANA